MERVLTSITYTQPFIGNDQKLPPSSKQMSNINSDISKGLSTFKVSIVSPKGVIEKTIVSHVEFQTDKDAVTAFKGHFQGHDFNDCFCENIMQEDILCYFTNEAGYKYVFIRNSFSPW